MGDSYVECLVDREKNISYFILRIVMYVACALCVLLALAGIPIMFILGVALGVIGAFVVPNPDYEYEYLYIGKELSIDKIIAKSKRKTVGSYDLNKMEFMCPLSSHELDSYKNKKTPVKDYSSAKKDANPYVIVYRDDRQECLIYFEPNSELLAAIKSVMPRKVIEY